MLCYGTYKAQICAAAFWIWSFVFILNTWTWHGEFFLEVPHYSWWSFPSPIRHQNTEALDIVPDKKRQMVHIEVHHSSYEKHSWAKVHSNIKTCEMNVNTCPAGDAAARLCLISKHLSTRYYVEISNKKGEKGYTRVWKNKAQWAKVPVWSLPRCVYYWGTKLSAGWVIYNFVIITGGVNETVALNPLSSFRGPSQD